jgi:hypothetical protein
MSQANPYQAPQADLDSRPAVSVEGIEKVAGGQRLVIWGILVNIAAWGLQLAISPFLGLLLSLGAIGLSLVGIFRLATGMGYATAVKILLLVAMLVPIVNVLLLLTVNARATRRLRAAGYRVGLLGASR